jgi:hypothetical protein
MIERNGCKHCPAANERNILSITEMHSFMGSNEAIVSLLMNGGSKIAWVKDEDGK